MERGVRLVRVTAWPARAFADVLDTPHGRKAQLAVAARLLSRIASGDYPELEQPLRSHLAGLGVHATAPGQGTPP